MTETDPYCWPDSTCLRNRLNIRDPERLLVSEFRIVAARDILIAQQTLPGEYNLEHFKSFHGELFQDVYDWAGETRTVNLHKPGATFAVWQFVDEQMSSVLHRLVATEGLLAGLKRQRFLAGFASFYGDINAVHPFREGNGRTQRAFLRQVAAAAGWRVDWSGLDACANIEASQQNLATADTAALIPLLNPIISQI